MPVKAGIKKIVKFAYWSVYGRAFRNPPVPAAVSSILFVCQGNICRSIFAEKIAEKNHNGSKTFSFHSAGVRALADNCPPAEAVMAARSFAVDLERHRSRQVDDSMVRSFDMIVCMETWHYKQLTGEHPEIRDRVFLLSLFDDRVDNRWDKFSVYNIRDPFGKTIEEFLDCFRRIDRCVGRMISSAEEGRQGAKA